MRSSKVIVSAFAVSCLLVAPATAGGLLGGLLGGSSGGGSSSSSSSSGGGSSSGGTSIGVPDVATVSLDSGASGTSGNATVLGGGGSTLNLGLSDLIGGNSNLGVTLPGTGNSTVDGLGSTVNGITANDGTVDTLVTDTGLSGSNGGLGGVLGGSGGLLGNGDGTGGPGGLGGLGGTGAGGGGYAGGAYFGGAGNAACMLDTRNVVRLLQARYSPAQVNQWGRAAGVQLVKIPVCPQIRQSVARAAASNASISMMQGMAANDPLISTSLGRAHSNAGHVLGVGQTGGNLVVYVY